MTRSSAALLHVWVSLLACQSGATTFAPDAGSTERAEPDASRECAGRFSVDGSACGCPPDDVPCATGGYAHFVISNVRGSGLPNEAGYLVEDDLVRDEITGLIWQRTQNHEAMTWVQAKTYCTGLELGGRADFRLPARIELVTVLDFDQLPVVIPELGEVVSDYHWSSSPAFLEGSAYSVYFGAGETTIADADPGRAFARCVAGPIDAVDGDQFEVAGSLARDRATGLVWSRETAFANLTDARAACAASGMRVPSVRELQSIVAEQEPSPAIDLRVFPDAVSGEYWTASMRGDDPWTVDFADGKTYADRRTHEELAVRCVGDGLE